MPETTAKFDHIASEISDVTSLFSRLGAFNGSAQYQELVREDAAYSAAVRWPLLAELQGLPVTVRHVGDEVE